MELFEKICENKKNSPNFVASVLCSTLTNLQRKGFDVVLLTHEHIIELFELLASNKIPKESLEIIFENIMSGKSETVSRAIESSAVTSINEEDLHVILDKIIQENIELVKRDGLRSIRTLMGISMKEVRGKASGKIVNELLEEKIKNIIKK
jgi:glutamyl-tRNA(Gln) amidotransferase subunit E